LVGVIVQQLLPRKDGQGLVLAAEVMSANNAIKNLIRENSIHQIYSAIQTGSAYGMVTFNTSLAKLVKNNLINREIALQFSSQPKELEALLIHV
jgi:twitching motility protein PilT